MSSALGKALGMTSTYTWTQVVDAIKGIPSRDVFTDAVNVGFGDKVYIRIPKGAYLNLASTGYPEIRVARSDVSPGTANRAQVLSGYTFSSANGSNLSGSMTNRGAYTDAVSLYTNDEAFYIRIPQGAYLTNTSSGYPEIVLKRSNDMYKITKVGGIGPGGANGYSCSINVTNGCYYIIAMGGDPGDYNKRIISGASIITELTTGDTPPNGSAHARMLLVKALSSKIGINWGDYAFWIAAKLG